jgi:hypothetical protein
VLKLTFWALLCINVAVFAYGQGYLGSVKGGEREPARLKNQLNADKLALITPAKAKAAQESSKAAAEVKAPEPVACLEIGNFSAADGKRFEALLAPLALGEKQSRQNVAGQEVTSHMVFIPPLGSKDAADKKAAELKNLGVSNYFIMTDNGISLGVFKSEAAAQTLLAALNKQGVHSARVAGRGSAINKLQYQFRAIDVDVRTRLEDLKAGFQGVDTRSCK